MMLALTPTGQERENPPTSQEPGGFRMRGCVYSSFSITVAMSSKDTPLSFNSESVE